MRAAGVVYPENVDRALHWKWALADGYVAVSMKTHSFKVVVEQDEDFDGNASGWHAHCPALESLGGSTWGKTREEALKNINEVVHMIVEELAEDGQPLPDGPPDSVEVEEVSQERPLIAVTV